MLVPMRCVVHLALPFALLVAPRIAVAHIELTSPSPRTLSQKDEHCGLAGAPRDPTPTTVTAGSTITLTWNETIGHPGWYRISFQPDGSTFEIPPASNGPYGDGTPGGNFPTEDLTGTTDPGSGSMILLDRIADNTGTGSYSQQVTLPNMLCTNCTLQLIQVMTSAHGPYNEPGGNDIYFQCADLILAATLPDAAPPGTPDAGPGNPGVPDAGPGGAGVDGGCGCRGGVGPSGILTVLAAVGLVRRRRSRT
jgi:hypothetical protein